MTSLNNFDAQYFLRHVWQQTPVVIRNAFEQTGWIEPNELAGLACEDEVESRIVLQESKRWRVEHGPFKESFFSTLPKNNWTLLVQAVDQWLPEVKALLEAFDFLPVWRLDDVMVSYAPVGGTVAPHFDYYDVFLIQGEGSRRWQVGQVCNEQSECEPDAPTKILKNFVPEMDVTLSSGDVLYVPARHAHYGVSVENSLTYSVGFRAPGIRDIVDGVATEALSYLQDDQRYVDTRQTLSAPNAEIPVAAIEQISNLLTSALTNKAFVQEWFGKYVTEPKYPDSSPLKLGVIKSSGRDKVVHKNPAARLAYSRQNPQSDECDLFVNGVQYNCSLALAKYLSGNARLEAGQLMAFAKSNDKAVLQALFDVEDGW